MKIQFGNEANQAAIQEVRAEQAAERAKEAARKMISYETSIQNAIDNVVNERKSYNRTLKKYDDFIRALKDAQANGDVCINKIIDMYNNSPVAVRRIAQVPEDLLCQFNQNQEESSE